VRQGDAAELQLPESVPLAATYRVVVACRLSLAETLLVAPKKENVKVAIQTHATKLLFKIDV
jgi:hypothetical protein